MIRVGYLMPATDAVFSAIRNALPSGCELITTAPGRDLDVLIAGKVSRDLMGASPRLRLIMTPGIGYDGIDLTAAAERGIPVAVTECGNTTEVAEFTLMLMLAVSRRLTELDAGLRAGRWMMWNRRLESFNLSGKTLGLIGYGRIGRAVAQRAAAFGMDVRYHDPQAHAGTISLEALLAVSDIVSLHIPLTPQTRGLIDKTALHTMRAGSVLINTSRGEVVDEPALIEALQTGHLAGAGLDVFAKEPADPANPLLSLPNVVVTPHVASGTRDGLYAKARHYATNIERVLGGLDPVGLLPAPATVQA